MIDAIITPMTTDHLPAVAEIEQSVFPDPWTPESFLEVIGITDKCWVAAQKGRTIGYLITQWVSDEIHILNVAVSPDFQRMGIGAALLNFLLRLGEQHGMRDVYLEVRSSNQPAQALYLEHGFVKLAVRKRYYRDGEDALVMHRTLADSCLQADGELPAGNGSGIERQA